MTTLKELKGLARQVTFATKPKTATFIKYDFVFDGPNYWPVSIWQAYTTRGKKHYFILSK